MIFKTQEERDEAYLDLFASGLNGPRVLADMAEVGGQLRPTFDPNPTVAAFNEGKRAFVVAILNTIERAKNLPPRSKRPEPAEPEPVPDYFQEEGTS